MRRMLQRQVVGLVRERRLVAHGDVGGQVAAADAVGRVAQSLEGVRQRARQEEAEPPPTPSATKNDTQGATSIPARAAGPESRSRRRQTGRPEDELVGERDPHSGLIGGGRPP